MKRVLLTVLALVFIATLGNAWAGASRDQIMIVGSSTVYPFATVVAEKFGKSTKFPTPKIESTGSGGGHKLFGKGIGTEHPDITNSSRRIKKSEFEKAKKNGIEIVEVKIGYDGIVVASSRKNAAFKLTRKELFLALAARVPDPKGGSKLVPNPYKTWKQINPALPDVKIEVLGPPPTSGTRDAFSEFVLEAGAKKFADLKAFRGLKQGDPQIQVMLEKFGFANAADMIAAFKKKKGKDPKGKDMFKKIAHSVREDGAYIEAGENDNLIVQKLEANPNALGIFGFSFLDQNTDRIQGSFINGVQPSFDAIADGSYPVSRPLFFYVKKAHVGTIAGMKEYLDEFTSEKAWGDEGYLTDKGLIPMPKAERQQFKDAVKNLKAMTAADFK